MNAYHGKQEVKDKYVQRMKDHMAADELIRGTGWEEGRGCAVGCTLNKFDHDAYPEELGLPVWLAHLEDTLHENTSDAVWPTFALNLLESIKPGANIEPVRNKINLFILKRNRARVEKLDISVDIKTQVIAAINQCIDLHADELKGIIIESARSAARSAAKSAARSAWSAARSAESAARSAAWSAESAAESAAWSAESAAWSAAWSAESAAESAAWSAWSAWSAESAAGSAARSAESAAWSAARSAAESAARSAAESAAGSAEYDAIAEELLRLLAGEK